MKPFYRAAVAMGGLLAMLVAGAPLLDVWQGGGENAAHAQRKPLSLAHALGNRPLTLTIDLQDGATDTDVFDIESRYGLDLTDNSVVANSNRLFNAVVPADKAVALVAELRRDSRVEAAEEEQIFTIPERGRLNVELPLTVTRVVSTHMELTEVQPKDGQCFCGITSLDQHAAEAWAHVVARSGARPNDPRYDEQWNFAMIGAEDAWKKTRGKGVVVAVIDTGVAAGDVRRGKPCRDFNKTPMVEGYNFVNNTTDAFDDNGHGTHVAGTIAESTNNNEGVAGLAYEASIMPLKVLSAEGSGTAADIADAIRWAADKGANIINMSLGSQFPSDVIQKACQYAKKKGVLIVCAAGNGFKEGVGFPAGFAECMAVSSVGPTKELAFYSSWGKQVSVAAPGGDMQEAGPAGGILQNTILDNGTGGQGDDYYAFQGTSMASPHVAGVAALVMAQGVKDAARVREILEQTAEKKADKKKYGAGILQAGAATRRAADLAGPKLRDKMLFVFGALLLATAFGDVRRKSVGLRFGMVGAIGLGFFGPDWAAGAFGADSALNLLTFSALAPVLVYLFAPLGGNGRIAGLKLASALALGVGVCLFANAHNGTIPFTTATFGFGPAAVWTLVNALTAFVVAFFAAWEGRARTAE